MKEIQYPGRGYIWAPPGHRAPVGQETQPSPLPQGQVKPTGRLGCLPSVLIAHSSGVAKMGSLHCATKRMPRVGGESARAAESMEGRVV